MKKMFIFLILLFSSLALGLEKLHADIVNGSFETGNFSGWITSDISDPFIPLTVSEGGKTTAHDWDNFFIVSPTDGGYCAIHGFDGKIGTIRIAQDVNVTSDKPILKFHYRAGWDMTLGGGTKNRTFDLNIEPNGGGNNLLKVNILNAYPIKNLDTGNLVAEVDLTAFAGTTVRISFDFTIPENSSGPGQFQLDKVSLISKGEAGGNINNTDKYGWSENGGWVNLKSTYGSAVVYNNHLSGYAWAENIGWIKLGKDSGTGAESNYYANTDSTNWGVNINVSGELSGYAWSEAIGWINFKPSHSQITIDSNGNFSGYAWSESVGWIHVNNSSIPYKVLKDNSISTMFEVKDISDPIQTGKSTNVTVTAKGEYGYTDINYLGTIHFTSTDTSATLPNDYSFTGIDKGTKTFVSGIIFKTAKENIVTATDTQNSGNRGSQRDITVKAVYPPVATCLKITGTSTMTAGGVQTITIKAHDDSGNVVTNYSGDKNLVFSGANASKSPVTNPTCSNKSGVDIAFGNTTVATFSNGEASITMKLYKAESAAINVTDGSINSNGDPSYALNVTVSNSSKNKILWITQPSSPITAGNVWPDFSLEITDSYGNRVSSTDNVTISPSSGSFNGTKIKAASSGLVTFNNITFNTASTITATASASGLTSSPASSSIIVNSGPANYFKITGTSTITAGTSQTITIKAYDQYGNVADTYSGDKNMVFSGANASKSPASSPTCSDKSGTDTAFGNSTTITFTNGTATSTMKLYKAEPATINVTDGTINSNGDSSYSLNVTISSASKNKLLWGTEPLSPVTAGVVWPSFKVEITDQYGNRTSDTDNITITPSSGSFTGTVTKAASSGIASFDDISYTISQTITVTGSSTGLISTNASNNVVVDPAPATYLKITGSGTMTAGSSQIITITAYDQYNNIDKNYIGNKNLTYSGANDSKSPVTNPTCTNNSGTDTPFGQNTITNFSSGQSTSTMKLYKAESVSINVTDGSINSNSNSLNVTVSSASKNKLLWVTEPTSPVKAGTIWPEFSIEITDIYGNSIQDTDSITVTPSSGAFTGTVSKNAVSGVVTFNDISYNTSGTITVTGSAAGLTSTNASKNISVNSESPTYLKITGSGTMVSGNSQTITITAYDQYNNIVNTYSGEKSLTFSGAAASKSPVTNPTCLNKSNSDVTFGNVTIVDFTNGQATSTMKLYKAESASVGVSDGTINSNGDPSYNLNVTVNTGNKTKLLWVSQPATPVNAGATWTDFTIEISDAYGNRISDTDNITITPSIGTFNGTVTKPAISGLATFNDISYTTSRTITVTGTASGLSDPPASNNVVVNSSAANYFKVTGNSNMAAGSSQTITITAYDQYGNISTGYAGDKGLKFSGANSSSSPVTNPTCSNKSSVDVLFGSDTIISFSNGQATSTMKLYKAESASIDAADGSITSNPSYSLPVSISVGAKNKILWLTQPSSPVIAGNVWTDFSLEITDSYGNRTSDTDNVTISPSSGSFNGTKVKTASSGVVTFNDITYNTASKITVAGSATGLSQSPPSNEITINPTALDHFTFNSISSPQTINGPFSITIYAKDIYENTVTSYIGTNTLSDSTGTITPATTDSFTNGTWTGNGAISKEQQQVAITTSGNAKTGQSNSFDVVWGDLASFIVDAPNQGTAGTGFNVTITAKDSKGNTTTKVTGDTILSVDDGTISPASISDTEFKDDGIWSGIVTLSKAGARTITSSNNSKTGTDSITISASSIYGFSFDSIPDQIAGTQFNIKIYAKDQNQNTVTSFTGTVDISSTGRLVSGKGTTFSFTNGELIHKVNFGNTTDAGFTITATRTSGSETGQSNSFKVTGGASEVWVNPDYSENSSESHIFGYDAFNKIQDGIDAVKIDGVVNVSSATYNEYLSINKGLTLNGKGPSPIIKGSGTGTLISVSASKVTIAGLTISDADTCIAITSGANNRLNLNNIIGGTTWLLHNTSGNSVDALNNWWGSVKGAENKIGDYVNADPWSRSEIKGIEATKLLASSSNTMQNDKLGIGADVKVNSKGNATISIARYKSNSTPVVFSPSFTDSFYDLHIVDGETNIDQILLKLYYQKDHRDL
ncbi:MAG: hypothetical protein HQK78_09500, partial [Desulfobacterales bacterium]|nr:hypothetical protein [Desulfobacterales bacterium]